jgi:hypothetical protein
MCQNSQHEFSPSFPRPSKADPRGFRHPRRITLPRCGSFFESILGGPLDDVPTTTKVQDLDRAKRKEATEIRTMKAQDQLKLTYEANDLELVEISSSPSQWGRTLTRCTPPSVDVVRRGAYSETAWHHVERPTYHNQRSRPRSCSRSFDCLPRPVSQNQA